MKKKTILLLSLTVACAVSATAFIVANHSGNLIAPEGEATTFEIHLDSDNHLFNTSSVSETKSRGYAKTKKGSDVEFEYPTNANITHSSCFIEFAEGGGSVYNTTAINGLINLNYKCNRDIHIYYGFSPDNLHYDLFLERTGSHSSDPYKSMVFQNDYGYPSFFKITCSEDVQIYDLSLTYTCSASVDPFRIDGEWEYTIKDAGQVTITGYHIDSDKIPSDGILVVPATFEGVKVYKINPGVLSNVPWVKHIVLPFVGQSWYIEEEMSHDFGSIFASSNPTGSTALTPIQQHKQTWFVPSGLKTVTVINGNRDYDLRYKIPNYAFYGADNLEVINLVGPTTAAQSTSYHVQIIGSYTFAHCTNVKEIYLPTSITTIDEGAFAGDDNLIIRSYGTYHFADSRNPSYAKLTENYIETVTYNGIIYDLYRSDDKVYANAMGLAYPLFASVLNLDHEVKANGKTYTCNSIANRAFMDLTNLERIYLPADMANVGHLAFKGCYRASIILKDDLSSEAYLSDWAKDTGIVAPNYTGEEATEFYNVSYLPLNNALFADYITESVGELRLDKSGSLVTIYVSAFFALGNDVIEALDLPKDIVLGDCAFKDCSNLTTVQYAGTVDEWNALVSNGFIGANIFAGTQVTQIICNGGYVPV